ncbi:FG-GAP repeat protein [Candidatus Fermentibacteria bacterium]|nr:FG-GAP repeat protein [Candidatus Fermentibacteria bacterium]
MVFTAASWMASGEAASDYFGLSVATAGDVDGDGYSDVVVGAYGNASNTGRAYLYGGNDGDDLGVLPRQWRIDLLTPVVPALKTGSQTEAS